VKPVLQALVLAERVYQEKSGKMIICGTFTGLRFMKKLPVKEVELPDGSKQMHIPGGMQGGAPCAYISVTDVCQNTTLRVQFSNLTKNLTLFGTDVTINCNDRLRTVEMALPLPLLPIGEPGTYALEVLCDGELLGFWRIKAEELNLE
jgi:hypothetical protein